MSILYLLVWHLQLIHHFIVHMSTVVLFIYNPSVPKLKYVTEVGRLVCSHVIPSPTQRLFCMCATISKILTILISLTILIQTMKAMLLYQSLNEAVHVLHQFLYSRLIRGICWLTNQIQRQLHIDPMLWLVFWKDDNMAIESHGICGHL